MNDRELIKTGNIGMIGQFRVYTDPNLVVNKQFRFPRSKSKRIQKKWTRDVRNRRDVPMKEILKTSCGFVCHPTVFEELKNQYKAMI